MTKAVGYVRVSTQEQADRHKSLSLKFYKQYHLDITKKQPHLYSGGCFFVASGDRLNYI